MLLIGFGHKARQGKNTAALAFLQECPLALVCRMYAFAYPLKREVRMASNACHGDVNLIEQFKEAGLMPDWVVPEAPKPRTLIQWWGTEYRRKQDPDYWVKKMDKMLTGHAPDIAVIPDVRFPNEAAYIKSKGGLLVECVRLGKPDVTVPDHPSEHMLDGYTGWDFHIRAKTVAECKQQARDIYREIMRTRGQS